MIDLTPKQLEIALYIRSGAASIRSLSEKTGNAYSTVHHHLGRLGAWGVIIWNPNQAKTIRLTNKGRALLTDYCLIPNGNGLKVGRIERR